MANFLKNKLKDNKLGSVKDTEPNLERDYEEEYGEEEYEEDEYDEYDEDDYDEEYSSKGRSTNVIALVIILIIIIIGLLIGGLYIYKQLSLMKSKYNYIEKKLNEESNNLAGILETDDEGNKIISYEDNKPKIKINDSIEDAKVSFSETGNPIITVTSINSEGVPVATKKVEKIQNIDYFSEEGMKKYEEKINKEREELELEKYRENFKTYNSVKGLPEDYYKEYNQTLKIKETVFKDLSIPENYEDVNNSFTVTNYQGNLLPSNENGYINREIIGRLLDIKFLSLWNIKVNLINGVPDIEVNIDDETIRNRVEEEFENINKINVYPEINIKNKDIIINDTFSKIIELLPTKEMIENNSNSISISSETFNSPGEYELTVELYNTISKSVNNEMTVKTSSGILYKMIHKHLNKEIKNLKNIVCNELNNYKNGICKSSDEISTLQIKSDYIQGAYEKAIINGVNEFIKAIYLTYNTL